MTTSHCPGRSSRAGRGADRDLRTSNARTAESHAASTAGARASERMIGMRETFG
jgi:hypothetical protein